MGHTAMVFIPVNDVTVADPPRISIDETMILVASLRVKTCESSPNECITNSNIPEKHEYEMSDSSPSSSYDFEPSMSIRGIEFEFCREL